MIRALILISIVGLCAAAPQFIISRPDPYRHPAVLANLAMEESLPNSLRNDFYKNPRIAAGLAEASWFGNKEGQVVNRETDMIPREKIYDILHHAGLAR